MKWVKRLSSVMAVMTMILILVGCGKSGQGSADKTDTIQNTNSASTTEKSATTEKETANAAGQETSDTGNDTGSDVLVVYFSRTGEQYAVGVIDKGNTAIVAEIIAEQTGADLWEVLPENDQYPKTYKELTDVAKKEQNDNARPAYAGEVPDLSRYDTVFIGAPVWWGDWPMIMYTFFENNQEGLAGKTLIPFSTHEGSGLSGFDRKLSSACPNSKVVEGLAIRGNDCQNDQDGVKKSVKGWLSGLGF